MFIYNFKTEMTPQTVINTSMEEFDIEKSTGISR